MKVYRISKWTFYGITLLILLLPVSRHWRLLAGGEKTEGRVIGFTAHTEKMGDGTVMLETTSVIEYTVCDSTFLAYGPANLEYRKGREMAILYEPGNPSNSIILTFSALYLNPYTTVPVMLFILWAAFYLSFNSYTDGNRRKSTRDLSFSPYKPFWKKDAGGKGEADRKGDAPGKVEAPGKNDSTGERKTPAKKDARGRGRATEKDGPGRKSLRMVLLIPLLTLFQLLTVLHNPALSRTIQVDPATGEGVINRILSGAMPGDTILFAPGTYSGPFVLARVHGAADLPVVILGSTPQGDMTRTRGIGDSWPAVPGPEDASVIDGQTDPGSGQDNQAFRLSDCSWIVIEGFVIRNCWTDLVRAVDVSYLSLRNCRMEGGKRALFATGRGSHHLLVEGCTWEQDQRVWTHREGYTWDEVHHGIHRHYNGSLFQGEGISGVFVLRENLVRNTFNAFRVSMIGNREEDPLASTNGEIYRNTVINTADNVLEPELHALNLHFYHNRMINGHAFVSITEVAGGDIFIYGNTAVSLPESGDGWTIFKISSRRTALSRPLYIFNNSWHVDFDMVGSPLNIWQNDHVKHFNNACFSAASDSFGIYNLGQDNFFDFDCSNVPFPELLTRNGQERYGIVADPGFSDPLEGDFSLVEGSPCIDRGMVEPLLLPQYQGEAPDIGAFDDGIPVEGPPFRFVPPEIPVPYGEMPRITRHSLEDDVLRLWFSAPLSERSVHAASFRLVVRGRTHIREKGTDEVREEGREDSLKEGRVVGRQNQIDQLPVELEPELSEEGYCLALSFSNPLLTQRTDLTNMFSDDLPERYLLQIEKKPESTTGIPMTGWASVIPVEFVNHR